MECERCGYKTPNGEIGKIAFDAHTLGHKAENIRIRRIIFNLYDEIKGENNDPR